MTYCNVMSNARAKTGIYLNLLILSHTICAKYRSPLEPEKLPRKIFQREFEKNRRHYTVTNPTHIIETAEDYPRGMSAMVREGKLILKGIVPMATSEWIYVALISFLQPSRLSVSKI